MVGRGDEVTRASLPLFLLLVTVAACGDDRACRLTPFDEGDPEGNADPLGASATEARAGRLTAAELPVVPSGLITWKPGDFVLANSRVALVIEDVGDSDLYDPWGGRPVGLARVQGGKLVEPNNFGEMFFLTGRSTVVTESVSVIADGSDGGTAIIRARGKLHPLPFFESLISVVYNDDYTDIEAAIDYELAPGATHVDVRMRYASSRSTPTVVPSTLHALMYTERTPVFQPGAGFDSTLSHAPYIALVDDRATSWAYVPGEGDLGTSLAVSGFLGAFSPGFTIPSCGTTSERLHAQLAIGGPGLDGVVAAVAELRGDSERVLHGTVDKGNVMLANVHVHALDAAGHYLSRTTTAGDGTFAIHVPADADVTLEAYRRGDAIGTAHVGLAAGDVAITVPETGTIRVVATEHGLPVPARVQLLPAGTTQLPTLPPNHGEAPIIDGRLHVEYAYTGDITLSAPPGQWEVIVSRGYEYELVRTTVTVAANQLVRVDAPLEHSVDTTNIQCGDFHVHTWRSNDSGDNAADKVAQAVADGVELPVRSDHEWVGDFAQEITDLGVEAFARGFGSIELTSFEVWGHMGVFPLVPHPDEINNGAPKWQTFPTAEHPETPFATLSPPKVFDAVRARDEAPIVIINHPRGPTNYFGYVGYDPATGLASSVSDWDTKFTLVEVFNNSSWLDNRNGTVADWFGLLQAGRKVFATGSSDSHKMSTSPVGYPRTCIALGTDDPRQLTAAHVRDELAAGHATVSGGIYVTATLGTAGPGDTTTGAGSPQLVDVTIQAPTWVDVDAIEVIVDGETVDTIPVLPADADPSNAAVRWRGQVPVQVRATGGFVVIAAYGNRALDPVHPGHKPFGVINPIFVTP